MPRFRFWLPPPHVKLQEDHLPQLLMAQSTGHLWVLHDCDSELGGHCFPPWRGFALGRWRVRRPPPHVALHAPQPVHVKTTQSCGQRCVLQLRCVVDAGHDEPPKSGWITVRVREWTPWPHVREHAPQAPHVATAQSLGQRRVLHARSSSRVGQAWP